MSKFLFIAYLILFAVCAIEPYDRAVWWAENAPVLLVVAAIAISNRYHKYSSLALIFMAVFIALHTIGGHYTFERVPFDWFTDSFGFERNHYDRIAHFSVGFYAFPIAEILKRNKLVNTNVILYLFPLFAIISTAGVYELFEWQYAISADAEAGIAVLGSQGDIWDAQKDILADTLGALFGLLVFRFKK
jgi:putative membrane protein